MQGKRLVLVLVLGLFSLSMKAETVVLEDVDCLSSLLDSPIINRQKFQAAGELRMLRTFEKDGRSVTEILSREGSVQVDGMSCANDSKKKIHDELVSMMREAPRKLTELKELKPPGSGPVFPGLGRQKEEYSELYRELAGGVVRALIRCANSGDETLAEAAKVALLVLHPRPQKTLLRRTESLPVPEKQDHSSATLRARTTAP